VTKNSCSLLDLTAVIIGTFTIGSFDMLSDEFPSLFPRCTHATDDDNKMRSRGYNNRGVPTLVLHGQKGFNEERWSNTSNKSGSGRRLETLTKDASDHIKLQKLEADELYEQSKNVSIAKSIRGGGNGNEQQQQSQDSTGNRKRPYFTYENTRIQLSKTPRRLRTGSKKKKKKIEEKETGKKKNEDAIDANGMDITEANAKKKASDARNSTSGNVDNCRKRSAADSITNETNTHHEQQQQVVKSTDAHTNNNASTKATIKKKKDEIEVIDLMDDSSDSDEDDDIKKKKPAVKSSALSTKPPPPISPPPDGSSTSNGRKGNVNQQQFSPPMKKQQPRQVMSLDDNNAHLSSNPLDLSKPKKKKQKLSVVAPNVPINVDTPPEARLPTTTQHTYATSTTTHEVVVKPQPTKASAAGTPKSKNTKKKPQPQPTTTTINNKPNQSPVSKLTPKTSAANILTHVLNKPQHNVTMRPIFYNDGSGIDSSQDGKFESQDSSFSTLNGVTMNPDSLYSNGSPRKKENMTSSAATGGGWGGIKPSDKFNGEVFFTQVLPKYQIPPSPKEREDKMRKKEKKKRAATPLTDNYSDEEEDDMMPKEKKQKTNKPEMKSARGVHHPKFYLLFERSGSLVVIVTSSNLTPQNSTEGSWIQRFEPRSTAPKLSYVQNGCGGVTRSGIDNSSASVVDFGMPSDFGVVLQDFLTKQAEAAEEGSLSPDVFLRRYVPGLSLGLSSLADQYRFEEAQVHLVSTVPGDYISGLPKNGNRSDATYRPRISYGPQRVSYILSRVFNDGHIKSSKLARASDTGRLGSNTSQEANQSWFHPALKRACERLVIQPTSLGGNWTTDDLETIVESYLQPHYQLPSDDDGNRTADDDSILSLIDILWPTMDYMDTMKSRRRAIRKKDPELASAIKKNYISKEDRELGEAFVFLSPDNFNKLDRSVIRRMAVYDHCQKVMPYKSTSLHFKSICRLLQLNNDQQKSTSSNLMAAPVPPDTREYLSWFMLTSACLSRGAQGQPTPYRDPTTDSMSYSNFELGVLFCSRMVGDSQNDRLYVSDPNYVNGCQCGKGKRFYKYWQANGELLPNFVDNVKKVHLPVPYNLRPKSYQQDPDSDMMSWTPYLQIPKNNTSSASVGNMKLTPLGEKIARDLTTDSPKGVRS